jgi:hypothetical protein
MLTNLPFFANQMKTIAFIFLAIFTVVQTAPALKSLYNDINVSIFNPDEEKGSEKVNENTIEEIKEKKNYLQQYTTENRRVVIKTAFSFHNNQHKLPLPLLDRFTPPPNAA